MFELLWQCTCTPCNYLGYRPVITKDKGKQAGTNKWRKVTRKLGKKEGSAQKKTNFI